jgi:Putative peptidoglycan binding domain
MTGKAGGRRFRRISPAVTFVLGLFLMICVGSLLTEPADAAPAGAAALRGHVSEFSSCPQLRLGSSGACVRQLQEQLDQHHVSPSLAVDGRFGRTTRKALRNFQRSQGLPSDGVAGPQTFRALDGTSPPAPRNSGSTWYSAIISFVENCLQSVRRHAGTCLLAFGGLVVLIFAAAALFGVKSVHLTFSRKRVDCDIERFAPQRIVNAQADVLRYYAEVQSRHPGQPLPPNDYIRSIGRGG